jgi:hypothetical protein
MGGRCPRGDGIWQCTLVHNLASTTYLHPRQPVLPVDGNMGCTHGLPMHILVLNDKRDFPY